MDYGRRRRAYRRPFDGRIAGFSPARLPIKRPPPGMRHGEHEDVIGMDLEADGIRKTVDESSSNRRGLPFCFWP